MEEGCPLPNAHLAVSLREYPLTKILTAAASGRSSVCCCCRGDKAKAAPDEREEPAMNQALVLSSSPPLCRPWGWVEAVPDMHRRRKI